MRIPRYLRFTNFILEPDNNLELSEIRVKDADGVPLPIVFTANKTPVVGTLDNLTDGLTTEVCAFSFYDSRRLTLDYDRGTDTVLSISEVLLGSGSSNTTFPLGFSLLGSVDGITFTPIYSFTNNYNIKKPQYPGSFSLQSTNSLSVADSSYNFDSMRKVADFIKRDVNNQLVYTRTLASASGHARPFACKPLRTGKWYLELTAREGSFGLIGRPDEVPLDANLGVGAAMSGIPITGTNTVVGYSAASGFGRSLGTASTMTFDRPYTAEAFDQPYGVCIDINARTMFLRRNNTNSPGAVNVPASSTGDYYPAIGTNSATHYDTIVVNMGEAPFFNTVPAGYAPLIEYNAAIFAFETLTEPYAPTSQLQLLHRSPSVWPGKLKSRVAKIRHSDIVLKPNYIGYIKGVVFIDSDVDIPVHRFITLMDAKSKATVACTWSNPVTGTYQFDHLDMTRKYIAWTQDFSGLLPPTITGPMDPLVMPIYA